MTEQKLNYIILDNIDAVTTAAQRVLDNDMFAVVLEYTKQQRIKVVKYFNCHEEDLEERISNELQDYNLLEDNHFAVFQVVEEDKGYIYKASPIIQTEKDNEPFQYYLLKSIIFKAGLQ